MKTALRCSKCGSADAYPYQTKPPRRGNQAGQSSHTCTDDCLQTGVFCRSCRFFNPVAEGGRLEVNVHDGGLAGAWTHDSNHGPWQATAPGWAVREFAGIMKMVREGKWYPPHPVGGLTEGHLVHCNGIWEDGELVVPAERDTYYAATVKMSDGTTSTLSLWRDAGFN
jgi:hypothetical protein